MRTLNLTLLCSGILYYDPFIALILWALVIAVEKAVAGVLGL